MPQIISSFNAQSELQVGDRTYKIFRLEALKEAGLPDPARLPVSLRVLLENLLRREDGHHIQRSDIEALAKWDPNHKSSQEIAFTPSRVILQDFTGVPAVVDFAANSRTHFPLRMLAEFKIKHKTKAANQ